ncbi:YfgL-like phosphoquinolipoprotein kinase [Oleiphilus messinensis]|uniref:Outer membrane protein assembly factor BamB n=1 Tax=Oleiphilus messinensis TaxID=141451 RepID=A0A1Y0I8I5_9GAMM|nr:PQQ-binding-like beta-propeller repeat protein [Oleiphilus messinensis]ARU56550.1 YfgL-like phosphoquinolipoprotein kinase [Oleiphilus messinensis]
MSIKAAALILITGLISACSSDDVKEAPAELEDFIERVKIVEVWDKSIGEGTDGRYLFLKPAIYGDTLYVADTEGLLLAIDKKTGETKWQHKLLEDVSGGVTADDENLYYSTFNGDVVALRRASLAETEAGIFSGWWTEKPAPVEELWRQKLTSEALAAPQVNQRLVVVQTIDGKVTAFGKETGELSWRFESDEPVLSLRGTASPFVDDQLTVTGFANGELVALENSTGAPVWRTQVGVPSGRTELERLVDVDGKVLRYEQLMFSAAFNSNLKALDYFSGREFWSRALSSSKSVSNGYLSVYASTGEGRILSIDRNTKSVIWEQKKLAYRRLTSPVVFDGSVLVADFEGYIHALSQTDGSIIGRTEIDSDGIRTDMFVDDGVLYVYGNGGTLAALTLEILTAPKLKKKPDADE